jgi:hypothetical protein
MAVDPITAALDIGGKLIDRLWPDPSQRDAAKLELLKLQQSGELVEITGQLKINEIEAASPSLWVSGWRPGVGWVCVAGLAYQFLAYPILIGWLPKIISLDMGTLLTLLAGMLGFGGMRTAEKLAGRAST